MTEERLPQQPFEVEKFYDPVGDRHYLRIECGRSRVEIGYSYPDRLSVIYAQDETKKVCHLKRDTRHKKTEWYDLLDKKGK